MGGSVFEPAIFSENGRTVSLRSGSALQDCRVVGVLRLRVELANPTYLGTTIAPGNSESPGTGLRTARKP